MSIKENVVWEKQIAQAGKICFGRLWRQLIIGYAFVIIPENDFSGAVLSERWCGTKSNTRNLEIHQILLLLGFTKSKQYPHKYQLCSYIFLLFFIYHQEKERREGRPTIYEEVLCDSKCPLPFCTSSAQLTENSTEAICESHSLFSASAGAELGGVMILKSM